MPDGDIFHRRLRGTGLGWQKSFRLLNFEPDRSDVDQELVKASAKNLRVLPQMFVANIVRVLLQSFREEKRNGLSGPKPKQDVYLNLTHALHGEEGGDDFEIASIVRESAKSFFLANREKCSFLPEQSIINGFAEKLVSGIVRSRLGRVRDVLQANSGRGVGSQLSWEQRIIERIAPNGQKMVKNYLNGTSHKFRAPNVSKPLQKSTEDFLRQPITALP